MVPSVAKLFSVLLVLALSAQTTLAAPARHSHLHNGVVKRNSCGAKQGDKVTMVNNSDVAATPPSIDESLDKANNVVNQGPDPESVIDSDQDDEAIKDEYEADPPAPVADITQSYSVIPMPSSTPSPDPQPNTPPEPEQDTPREPVTPPKAESPGVCVSPLLPTLSRAITFHQPLSQILSHTTDAIRVLTSNVNAKTGQFNQGGGEFFVWASSNGWTSIAINDRLNGKREFEKDVVAGLQAMADHWVMGGEKWKVPLVNEFNDDSGWAGLAAAEAYDAYGDEKYLKWAIGVFDFLMAHGYVRQSDIEKGYLEGTKNADVKILKECNGKSLLGGVAWKNTPDGAGLNAVSTGNFALLAAELCRITGDKQKYCDPAVQSMRFLDDHLLTADGLLKDHIISDSCEGKDWKFTYNAGLCIATYASLGATLSNPDFIAKSEAMITASLKTSEWNNDLGVIKQGSGKWDVSDDGLGFKSIYVRYLQKVHPWLANQAIKDAIVQYVNIQYDSLVWAASDSTVDPVNFGRSWDGNGGKGYEGSTVHSQIAALDALNAIQLNPPSAFPAQMNGDSVTTSEQGVARC